MDLACVKKELHRSALRTLREENHRGDVDQAVTETPGAVFGAKGGGSQSRFCKVVR